MRLFAVLTATTVLVAPAAAADRVLSGAQPAWVIDNKVPAPPTGEPTMPVDILLSDQQAFLEPGRTSIFSRQVLRIATVEGLVAGNISLPWRPDKDSITVHSLKIIRGNEVVDILARGQTFSVLRRETNLENAMLDGVLTGNIQPEGLQVGDILDLSYTLTSQDPVLKGTSELTAIFPQIPVGRYHLSVRWPSDFPIRHRESGGLVSPKIVRDRSGELIRYSLDNIAPASLPKGAPPRFLLGKMLEMTSFKDWAEIGALLSPLFQKAAVIPPSGPLRTEVEKIRTASSDPSRRAELALALVQDRIRYVALAMGDGGLVPDSAETTWGRRFGDCKAKTALLLAILREFGIEAVPVAVNNQFNDGMDQRLPMVGLFNHVLVRATIGGKHYWLDGTRVGDASLERIQVPSLSWGLELLPANGKLVRIMPDPLSQPDSETLLEFDASAGLSLPAPGRIEMIFRQDRALAMNSAVLSLPPHQRDQAFRDLVNRQYDGLDISSVTSRFDKATGEYRLVYQGKRRLDWAGKSLSLDAGFGPRPDLDRKPGVEQQIPVALGYPIFNRKRLTLKLPADFIARKSQSFEPVAVTLAGIEYRRSANWTKDGFTIESSERSLVPEVSWAAVNAATGQFDQLQTNVSLNVPAGYKAGDEELQALTSTKLTEEDDLVDRAIKLMDNGRLDEALKDLNAALAKAPNSEYALANRAIVYIWLQNDVAAKADLEATERLNPRNAVAARARGLQAFIAGNDGGAVEWFTKAIDYEPANAFAFGYRGLAAFRLRNYDQAIADTSRALELSPDWRELRFIRAEIQRRRGNPQAALEEVATLKGSEEPEVQSRLAFLYRRLDRWSDAEAALQKVAAKDGSARVLLERAKLRPRADLANRQADLEAYLKKEPTSPQGIAELAKVLEERGDQAGALKLYNRGIAALSDGAYLKLRRGILLIRMGRATEGRRDLAALPAATKASDYNDRCWVRATAGIDLDKALADCNAGLKLRPDSRPLMDSRGFTYLRLGKLDEALSDFNRALAKGDMAASLMGRSLVWQRKGNLEKAEADRKAAVEIDPEIVEEYNGYLSHKQDGT